jgi:hypothetical protein
MNASPARLWPASLLLPAIALVLAIVAALGAFDSARADTSGPNASGYVWIDSNAPDPTVAFSWIDATGGTISTMTDNDDDWETVTLPFTFNFFGTDYTEVDLSSNGFLSFDIDNVCNSNYNDGPDEFGVGIPPGDPDCNSGNVYWGGMPLIAPWFDDLDPGECGDVYYDTQGSAPNRMFIVEFNDVCHNDCDDCVDGEGITFETILFETSNNIKIQYMDVVFTDNPGDDPDLVEEDYGASATTGIDKDDTVGLQYSWADPLTDNRRPSHLQDRGDERRPRRRHRRHRHRRPARRPQLRLRDAEPGLVQRGGWHSYLQPRHHRRGRLGNRRYRRRRDGRGPDQQRCRSQRRPDERRRQRHRNRRPQRRRCANTDAEPEPDAGPAAGHRRAAGRRQQSVHARRHRRRADGHSRGRLLGRQAGSRSPIELAIR